MKNVNSISLFCQMGLNKMQHLKRKPSILLLKVTPTEWYSSAKKPNLTYLLSPVLMEDTFFLIQ